MLFRSSSSALSSPSSCCGSYTPFSQRCPSQSGSLQNRAGLVSKRPAPQGPTQAARREGHTWRGSSGPHASLPLTPASSWRCVCRGGEAGGWQVQRNENSLSLNLSSILYCSVLLRACQVTWSCLTLPNPMDCSPPGSSVHGLLQARILEWVAMPSSRGSSRHRDGTQVCCTGRQVLYH